MSTKIENKGYRTLSVREPGEMKIIKPGETVTVDRALDERETNALILAGAKVTGVKPDEALEAKARGEQADATPARQAPAPTPAPEAKPETKPK